MIDIEVTPVRNIGDIGPLWAGLESQCDATPFQTWAWIGPWLEMVIDRFSTDAVLATRHGELIGLGLLVHRRFRRKGIIAVDALYLNETGPSDVDFCTEYNGFLLRKGWEKQVTSAILSHLSSGSRRWDELHVRRALCTSELPLTSPCGGFRVRAEDFTPSPYVDLASIRRSGGRYSDALSRNRRSQIRREMRRWAAHGDLAVDAAASAQEALDYFSRLEEYHQKHWIRRGHPGAFANPLFGAFHRRMISDGIADGKVQILRVRAGSLVFGFIYSLVQGDRVYMIQSGFDYDIDAKRHPGELAHVLAIEWNLDNGFGRYDFLGGEARYKRSLATHENLLGHIVVQRRSIKFMAEDMARQAYHGVKWLGGTLRPSSQSRGAMG